MAGIMIAFLIGIVLSALGWVPEQIHKRVDLLLIIVLVFLLFGMGLNIGMDETIVQNIFELGKTAFFISLASVFGSVIFVWYFGKMIFGDWL